MGILCTWGISFIQIKSHHLYKTRREKTSLRGGGEILKPKSALEESILGATTKENWKSITNAEASLIPLSQNEGKDWSWIGSKDKLWAMKGQETSNKGTSDS